MAEAASHADVSLDAFLAWEEAQNARYERVGGVVRMMAGETADHDRIGVNVAAALHSRLRGSSCAAHGSNLKVVSPRGDVFYPDAFVRCGSLSGRSTTAGDPVVVVEVLSESTALSDLTRKRQAYKTIPSLRVIVYVSPDRARIDLVRRGTDGRWDDEDAVESMEAELALPEIGVSLPMAEIYAGTEVEAAA
jgi:Uma2 family endonuclease